LHAAESWCEHSDQGRPADSSLRTEGFGEALGPGYLCFLCFLHFLCAAADDLLRLCFLHRFGCALPFDPRVPWPPEPEPGLPWSGGVIGSVSTTLVKGW
jgi:hypothetical protein